jgi:hypothetical protein
MAERIILTAAELSWLLALYDRPEAEAARVRLKLDTDDTEPVRFAGLSSLAARGVLGVVDSRVRVSPEVAAVVDGLVHARCWVTIGLVAADLADGAHLCAGASERFLISPRAFRCFEIIGLDPAGDLRDPIVEIAASFLRRNAPATAALEIEHVGDGGSAQERVPAGEAGPAAEPRLISLTAAPDGRWTLSAGVVEELVSEQVDADQAEAALGAALTEALTGLPAQRY